MINRMTRTALMALLILGAGTAAVQPVCAQGGCCKICKAGKACGNTCIARDKRCTAGAGCACDG